MTERNVKQVKLEGFWVRRGNEAFLIGQVYRNKANAELVCKGRNLDQMNQTESRVIPVEITYYE